VNRDTQLTREEIAAEALCQFDAGPGEPSIRSLAAALRVAPTAIYYHFPSRGAIVQAVVELVWGQASAELLAIVPAPLDADPVELLVAVGIATRRAWLAHHRVVPYMAATPEANEFTDNALGMLAVVFERMGLEGERAAFAMHSYAAFMLGAVLFAAMRKGADERLLGGDDKSDAGRFHSRPTPDAARLSSERTRIAIDEVMDVSAVDPARDEQLTANGLRRLIASLTAPAAPAGVTDQ
jgi:AcrR family transcriptional regulator